MILVDLILFALGKTFVSYTSFVCSSIVSKTINILKWKHEVLGIKNNKGMR